MSSAKLPDVRGTIDTPAGKARTFNPMKMKDLGFEVERLPYSVRVLLEGALRHAGSVEGSAEAALALAEWPRSVGKEMPFMPYRVLLQDYTGVPLVVDLAGMRDAAKTAGLDPRAVDSKVPVDLVVDHSVQVDAWSSGAAISLNLEHEYERNSERYALLKWAQSSFRGMRVFPPGKGICHQVNLEYIARVVTTARGADGPVAFPDTLLGTDSHTTMVNGLGVLGWGVGGIEAEAVMLGEPYHMPIPRVVGVRFTGSLQEGVTPTDLVLTVTERLRALNVVGAFVEYFGDGYGRLSVPDRATMGNMSPEYGATVGFCPVDDATLAYLRGTGRDAAHVEMVGRYARENGLFVGGEEPRYSDVLEIDLDKVEPSVAGPRNPEERRALRSVPGFVHGLLGQRAAEATATTSGGSQLLVRGSPATHERIADGSVIIAAITSCTNTSNPTLMVGAGLLARNAVRKGLQPKWWVKRSLAPGSTVVSDYLNGSGLQEFLDKLGFNVVGYGCTTCIGNSGPLAPEVEKSVRENDTYGVAVLSGNRNFDGRIHPLAKGSFLMSPVLVVAYALAGRIDFDFYSTPIGSDSDGRPVFLKDLWPDMKEVKSVVERSLTPDLYRKRYADATSGDDRWNSLRAAPGDVYSWEDSSTYIRSPPWFTPALKESAKKDIAGARVLALLEDKVTTDHISPAGTIPVDSPAGKYLMAHGVDMVHFSTYGSRRGNHEVMVRGGFSNIRLRNRLAPGKEGGYTTDGEGKEPVSIYDASVEYQKRGIPLLIIAGKRYGTGSSRDWAAKAPKLLGVRAVIAESFERIHRSNLIAMGVVPLQFEEGESSASLGLTGRETYDVTGLAELKVKGTVAVVARSEKCEKRFAALARVDNQTEMRYLETGGVMPYVLGKLATR